MSNPTIISSVASPVKVEAPKELPKVSLVNESLKKLKFQLAKFDNVVKIRTTPDALQTVFDQMDAAVQQSLVDKQCLEIAKKELLLENNRLLQQIMSQDVLLTMVNSMSLNGKSVNMERKRNESCDKCYNLDAELLKTQNAHNDLLKSYSQLEKHYISLEFSIQLNQEIFQKDESYNNAFEIPEYIENNDLKAQLQDKDTTICKMKEIIKSIRENSKEENVNYDYCEIKTKNVELENSVAKLLSENERLCKEINHVKQVFKDQFDSIKKTHVHTKEHSDSLIDKLNFKSAKNEDLKAQIQDNVFVITSLKNNLQKVKGKEIVDIAAQIPFANTIVPVMFKLDLEPLAPRLLKNRETHIDYLKYTQEQANNLQEIFEQAIAKQPLDKELDFASNIVPPKKTTSYSVETQKPELQVYSRKPKSVKNVDIPSSSSLVMTGCLYYSLVSGLWMFETYDREPLSAHELLYCIEGLGHNLFFVGQFCDADLEVAFWKNTCIIRNLEGVDLLSGSRDTNLYIISLDDMLKTSPICLLSKASKTKSWKSKKSSHQPKAEDTNQEKLYLLYMDLCGPKHVASINRKRYILVIVDDYSRFTWVRLLRSKDEAPDAIIKCIKNIQVRLNATVRNVRTEHLASNICCPHSSTERRCRKLMQDKNPDLSFFHVFGALCYPTNDNDDLGKLDAKADIGIFVGYAPAKKAFRIYNKRTRKIIETIHVIFDELTAISSEQFSLGHGLHSMTPATSLSLKVKEQARAQHARSSQNLFLFYPAGKSKL
ncbi:retrovirus-related pol polyprotein from transposon TNT 1-94 [Tanacetum coccineum]